LTFVVIFLIIAAHEHNENLQKHYYYSTASGGLKQFVFAKILKNPPIGGFFALGLCVF